MKRSKLAIAAATTASAQPADPTPRGGSAMWLYQSLMLDAMHRFNNVNGPDKHPSEVFISNMLSSLPLAIMLFPLQVIAEAELALSSTFAR